MCCDGSPRVLRPHRWPLPGPRWPQELHKGLCDLLTYEDADNIEEIYGRSFAVETEVYGAQVISSSDSFLGADC